MIRYFAGHPTAANLLMIAFLAMGLIGLPNLKRETFPDFKYRIDTLEEWIANNLNGQSEPLDVYSLHMYRPYGAGAKGEVKRMGCRDNMELFEKTIMAMKTASGMLTVVHSS